MNLVERLIDEVRLLRKRIVICGDRIVDHWVRGYVTECQDGCPKFVEESYVITPGGAANAHSCLCHWDVTVDLFGPLLNIPHKWRFVNRSDKIVYRWDSETVPSRPDYEWIYDQALGAMEQAAVVLLSDYDKGFLTHDFIHRVVVFCAERGIPCIADAKRPPITYTGTLLKCNSEYAYKYCAELEGWVPLVVTCGSEPPVPNGLPYCLPDVPCVNHVGAGDCFAAHLALAVACRFPLEEAAAIAHSAGRIYVQHPHNRPPLPQEIAADLPTAVRG